MPRYANSTRSGGSFDAATIRAVWSKGKIVAGYDPARYRKDACNAWIDFYAYGNTDSNFGWEIDHIKPVAKDGSDNLSNLQPLNWRNNRYKSDTYPNWSCAISH